MAAALVLSILAILLSTVLAGRTWRAGRCIYELAQTAKAACHRLDSLEAATAKAICEESGALALTDGFDHLEDLERTRHHLAKVMVNLTAERQASASKAQGIHLDRSLKVSLYRLSDSEFAVLRSTVKGVEIGRRAAK